MLCHDRYLEANKYGGKGDGVVNDNSENDVAK